MYGMRGAAAYGRVGVESHVLSASPHKLIALLFEGAQKQIKAAQLHLENGNASEKGKAIGKALDIVNQGLLAALDKEKGGDIALQLEQLYHYVSDLLLRANLHNNAQLLEEAARLLNDIGSAWQEIGSEVEGA